MDKNLLSEALRISQAGDGLDGETLVKLQRENQTRIVKTRNFNATLRTITYTIIALVMAFSYAVSKLREGHDDNRGQDPPKPTHTLPIKVRGAPGD